MNMTKFFKTLLLSLVGAIVLVAGAFYFGAPLFGWLIIVAIFGIYLISSIRISLGIRADEKERAKLERYAGLLERGSLPAESELDGASTIDSRIRFLKYSKGNSDWNAEDLPYLKSAWSASEDAVEESRGGVVVLLGLMGTFFGLMLSINAAGSAIDTNVTSETTLGIIQNIFSSMKGIFGSSLCGLFAALILNAVHSVYASAHEKWMADLDAFTLLWLLPKKSSGEGGILAQIGNLVDSLKKSDAARAKDFEKLAETLRAAEASRSESLERNLESLRTAGESAFADVQREFAESFAKTADRALQNLGSVQRASLENLSAVQKSASEAFAHSGASATSEIRDSLSQVISGLAAEMQRLSSSVQSIESGVVEGLEKEIANLSSNVSAAISGHLDRQMQSSGENWNAFMESLRASAEKVADAERKGLESLRAVADEVAARANDSTVGLSDAVKCEMESLSQKVQSSFSELAKSSESLVAAEQSIVSGIASREEKENAAAQALAENIAETAKLMRVNQSELAANLEMFGHGVEAVLSKISGDVPERENEKNFVEQLNTALQSFQERSGEVLLENALKTQEILLEILDQVQKSPAGKAE